ncbi:hypothetical protein COJ07_12580 [Bacillus cereus]|uniref:UPF0473 protein COK86_08855 n=1 Tax=Bacillus cereus TaxID=1396 RepID=A0A2B3UBJ2_BACCE|nr:DUF1292 domain-containing protein [Bacillus cereus]PFL20612.1 hypothetical protein COJ07_12580 [Bacillus cereus]PFU44205.1 hypothetical protein COK86_08855 [Bacillus cereus]
MEEKQIIIVDENNEEKLCDILFTFESEEFGNKWYVIFSPIGEVDEDGDPIVDALICEPNEGEEDGGRLLPIELDKEWEMVQEVYNTFVEEEEAKEE